MRRVRRAASGFLVNGYPDGELAHDLTMRHGRRAAALERWRRIQNGKRLREQKEATLAKLETMEPIGLLDCSYAARDLFNAAPRLSTEDQATLIDYIEMRVAMWRKANNPPETKGEAE